MEVTENLFRNFFQCPYKAHLLAKGDVGQKSEYEVFQDEVSKSYSAEVE